MDLKDYSFLEVGHWRLKESLKSRIAFELNSLENERVIYAFVVGGEAKYIGICDKKTTTLKDRMGRYKGMVGGSTNERIAGEIRHCLRRGESVDIFALNPKSSLGYKGLSIDLVKGLENPLLEAIDPDWNVYK